MLGESCAALRTRRTVAPYSDAMRGEQGSAARSEVGARRWMVLAVGAILIVTLVVWALLASGVATGGQGAPVPSATAAPTAEVTAVPPASTSASPAASASATEDADEGDAPPPVRETLAPVALGEAASASRDVTVELLSIEPVTGIANIAGEVGGPALRVTVEAVNRSGAPFQTPAVVVNLYTGADRAPAGDIREPGSREFPSSIEAGSSAVGVYIFTVAENDRDQVLVEVDLQVEEPVVLFEGAVR